MWLMDTMPSSMGAAPTETLLNFCVEESVRTLVRRKVGVLCIGGVPRGVGVLHRGGVCGEVGVLHRGGVLCRGEVCGEVGYPEG